MTEVQQIEILTKLSEAPVPKVARPQDSTYKPTLFFEAIKNLTADGYYTSRIGLLQELGYSGNAVLAAFPEATIPEQ